MKMQYFQGLIPAFIYDTSYLIYKKKSFYFQQHFIFTTTSQNHTLLFFLKKKQDKAGMSFSPFLHLQQLAVPTVIVFQRLILTISFYFYDIVFGYKRRKISSKVLQYLCLLRYRKRHL